MNIKNQQNYTHYHHHHSMSNIYAESQQIAFSNEMSRLKNITKRELYDKITEANNMMEIGNRMPICNVYFDCYSYDENENPITHIVVNGYKFYVRSILENPSFSEDLCKFYENKYGFPVSIKTFRVKKDDGKFREMAKICFHFKKTHNTQNLNIISELKGTSYSEIIEESTKKRINASVLTFGLKFQRNIAAMCRTSEIFGIQNFITIGSTNLDMRTAMGSHNYLSFAKHKCDIENTQELKSVFNSVIEHNNFIPIFIEQGGLSLSDVNWNDYDNDHVCFIFGSEDKGIHPELLEMKNVYNKSLVVSIEQFGIGRSLNVSSACAIVLHNYATTTKTKTKTKTKKLN